MEPELRAIILFVPASALLEYLTGKRVLANVPDGAKLTSAWIHSEHGAFGESPRALALRLEHESFEPVTRGTRIPYVKARFRRITK